MSENINQPDEFWSVLARVERNATVRLATWMIAAGALFALWVVTILVAVSLNSDLNRALANRVMWATPMSDGSFISSQGRPDEMVKWYGDRFLAHAMNYTPRTAEEQMEEAVQLLYAPLRNSRKVGDRIRQTADNAKANAFTQVFNITARRKPEDLGDQYEYQVRGRVTQYIGTQQHDAYDVLVTLTMQKTMTTSDNFAGLGVVSISERRL